MTPKRFTLTSVVAFVVSQILAIAIHGFILAGDYQPYHGKLLRLMAGSPQWPALFLPVAHLSFVVALVWVYGRMVQPGRWVSQGLTLGLAGWFLGQVPHWLLLYAEQPWPGDLVVKQLGLELLSSLIVGLTVAAMARQPDERRAMVASAA
jgi:hypothetical protein